MFLTPNTYLEGTRHPWTSLLFVVPLLLAYEGGRWAAGPAALQEVRNGAEHWMRLAVEFLGFPANFAAPGVPLAVLLAWCLFRRHDRPGAFISLGIGMIVEMPFSPADSICLARRSCRSSTVWASTCKRPRPVRLSAGIRTWSRCCDTWERAFTKRPCSA